MTYDVIIIGGGPAGISASLYSKRANLNVMVIYHGESQLEKAHKIDNYYGFENGISGEELYRSGIKQAKNIGVEVLDEEVINIMMEENNIFSIETINNCFNTKAVIIATGNKKITPKIKGIKDFEGKGVSYCAICDGFFYRKKDVAVLGNGEFALSEANDLVNVVNNITILTNGLEMPETREYEVDTRKIKEVCGDNRVSAVEFEDGERMPIDGIFIAQGVAGGSDFAKKLGIIVNNDDLVVDENMKTNINGIFACGNLTGGLLQVSKAVYEGAKAGLAAVSYVKTLKI